MDGEQIRLLQLATQETDSVKLMELIEEIIWRFEDEDPSVLRAALSAMRNRRGSAAV